MNKDFYNAVILSGDTKILISISINLIKQYQYHDQYHKSDKTPFIIYVDLESLLEKIDGFKNNPKQR